MSSTTTTSIAENAEACKAAGNALFAKGEVEAAMTAYSEALAVAKDKKELRCTVLCNRAACHLKLRDYKKCEKDCTKALELDGGRVKALFRRAAAREGLREWRTAFEDAARAVKLDPSNVEAARLARRLKEKLTKTLEKQGAWDAPAAKIAKRIVDAHATFGKDRELEDAFRAGAGAAADDAAEFWRSGACAVACVRVRLLEDVVAARFLAACCLGAKTTREQLAKLVDGDVFEVKGLLRQDTALLVVAATVAEIVNNDDESDASSLEEDPFEDLVARVAAAALESRRDGALDVVAKWLGPLPVEGTCQKNAAEEKKRRDARRARSTARVAKYALTDDYDALWRGLWRLLDAEDAALRQKAQGVVARVVRAIAAPTVDGQLQFSDEEDGSVYTPSDLLEKFLDHQDDDHMMEEGSSSRDLRHRRRRASLVVAFTTAASGLGAKALRRCFAEEDGSATAVVQLVATKDPVAETLGAEVLAAAAACEEGRAFLEPLVASGALEGLMRDATSKAARSAAATAVARLGLAAKALKAGSSETGHLLASAVSLCEQATSAAEMERGVEVIASLSNDSSVKEEIAHGSGRAKQCLGVLGANDPKGSDPVAYGIATVLAHVTVTNDELRRRHFREKEMDITPEQYDEFMKVTKQKQAEDADNDTEALAAGRRRKVVLNDGALLVARLATTGPSRQTAEKLAETLVNLAKDVDLRGTLVQQGAFRASVELAADKQSAPCRTNAAHAVARTLVTTDPRNLTDVQTLSAVRPLLWLCEQYHAPDLAHFEACLALTNLLSLGAEFKQRVAKAKGIRILEYLQFSENNACQRAATEALTNMVPNVDFLAHLKKQDKLKLWFAFARAYQEEPGDDDQGGEEDLALARAATGCLAMASGADDEDLCALMAAQNTETVVGLLGMREPSLVHRCAVLVRNLAADPVARPLFFKRIPNLADLVRRAKETTFKHTPLVADALQEALDSIAHEPPSSAAEGDVVES